MIFFPLTVNGLVEVLGDVEAVHHRLGLGQELLTGVVERLRHVRPVGLHPLPLRLGYLFQALAGRGLVAPGRHGQHFRPLRVAQVGQDGGIQLVPLLQAQLVDAHVGNHSLRIDLLGLGVGQLVFDDQADHLGGDAQTPGHFLFVAADQQPQDLLLEAVGVAGVLALEGRDQPLPVVAPAAAVERRRIDPEARLPADVQVADDLDSVRELRADCSFPPATVTTAARG